MSFVKRSTSGPVSSCSGLQKSLRLTVADERGQANAEYVLALFVSLVVVLSLVGLIGFFGGLESQSGSTKQAARSEHSFKTFSRAPYTLPSKGAVSEQWLKDLLMH